MMGRAIPALAATGLLLLAACSTTSESDLAGRYKSPDGGGADLAQISGTRSGGGLWDEDHRGYVLLIDNLFVPDARTNWQKPLTLAPGEHVITAVYAYGTYVARTELKLQAQAGGAYRLKFKYGTEGPKQQPYNDFWIENTADGKPVTAVQHSIVTGGSTYSPFEVN